MRNTWLRFSDVADRVSSCPGYYEIRGVGKDLKVGIAGDLRRRLLQHAKSSQNRLKSDEPGPWHNPSQVKSKGSILAKHLYFDRSIAPQYDLRTEKGRQKFLNESCRVRVIVTGTREAARAVEKQREALGKLRYVGKVRIQ